MLKWQEKIQSILNLKPPKTLKQVRSVLGLIQYYRDLWPRRSETLAPLTELTKTPKNTKNTNAIQWTDIHQNDFDTMKKIISKDTMLAYPRFDHPFTVVTDSIKVQFKKN